MGPKAGLKPMLELVAVTTFLSGAAYLVKWGRKADSMEDSL